MEFDPTIFAIGGISIMAIVFGLTEFIKTLLGWEGKKVTALASCLGAVMMVLYQLQSLLPEPYGKAYLIVMMSLAFGMSASGYYKYGQARAAKKTKITDN